MEQDEIKVILNALKGDYLQPIVLDEMTGTVQSGHARLALVQQLIRDGRLPPEFEIRVKTSGGAQWLVRIERQL